MARYVMANRRAGMFRDVDKKASRSAVDGMMSRVANNTLMIDDTAPSDPLARRVVVFEAEPATALSMQAQLPPDVLLEASIPHYRSVAKVRTDLLNMRAVAAVDGGVSRDFARSVAAMLAAPEWAAAPQRRANQIQATLTGTVRRYRTC
jgi:hypothetical protein